MFTKELDAANSEVRKLAEHRAELGKVFKRGRAKMLLAAAGKSSEDASTSAEGAE